MIVENTNGDAQPADASTQQSATNETEAISGLESMVVGDEPVAEEQESTSEETPADEAETTDVEDESETEEETEDSDEESESDEEEADPKAKAHKGERAEKRIHKLTAQRNEAREKLETTEKALQAARLKAESSIPLERDYLNADELAKVQKAITLGDRKKFLMKHIGVGVEDPSDESKSLTAKQVAEELAAIEDHADEISEAQKLYRERKQQQLDDMKAGRMLRLSKASLTKIKKTAPTVKTTPASATAARSVASSLPQRRGVNADRFVKNGGDRDAALRELEEMVPA